MVADICFLVDWTMNLKRSQAMAPMQKDDMKMGYSWAALLAMHSTSVFSPSGQPPSRADHRISGEVNVHRKKSEVAARKERKLEGNQQWHFKCYFRACYR